MMKLLYGPNESALVNKSLRRKNMVASLPHNMRENSDFVYLKE